MIVPRKVSKAPRCVLAVGIAISLTLLSAERAAAASGNGSTPATVTGERYEPAIWIDPDGCEHWVMDDGAEGYMSPHVDRNGIPVCPGGKVCATMNTDNFFPSGSYRISSAGQQSLREFFRSEPATAFNIVGHTDSRGSDAYNMRLSKKRANSVARIAKNAGVRVNEVSGYGERRPIANNNTAAGMEQNRRVEIICVR